MRLFFGSRTRLGQGKHVVALRLRFPDFPSDILAGRASADLTAGRQEDDVLSPCRLEHRRNSLGIAVELLFPKNFSSVFVESVDKTVAPRSDKDQTAGGHHGTIMIGGQRQLDGARV